MNIIVSRPLTHVIILHSIISKDSCFLNNLPKYKIPYKSLHTVYRRMVILWSFHKLRYRRMVILRYTPAAWNLDWHCSSEITHIYAGKGRLYGC